MTAAPAPAATPPRPRLILLILLTGMSVLSLNMVLPSLPRIAVELETSYALVSLSIAGYLALTAVVQLVAGPLSDRYGRRPVLLVALVLYVIASLGCALATDIRVFLAMRMLQGAVITGYTMALALIRDTVEERTAARLIAWVGMAMAIGPMLGPMVGGLLETMLGWRATFLALATLGGGVFLLVALDLKETNLSPAATLGAQFRRYPVLLADRRFWAYALCTAFSTAAFYVFLTGVPLVARDTFAMPPAQLGFWMGSITAGYMLGSFLSGRATRRFDLSSVMIAGRMVACAGLLVGLVLWLSGVVSVPSFFGATWCVGLGNGLTTPCSSAGALSVRPDLRGSAAGLAGALTVGGAAVLTSATGAMLAWGSAGAILLTIMLVSSALGLLAAVQARRSKRDLAPSGKRGIL